MPMGEDGHWRPGTREDQRREAAALGEDKGARLMRWASPVFAASFWIFFFMQWSLGRRWSEDGLIWHVLIAAGWTLLAGLSWSTHLRAGSRRT